MLVGCCTTGGPRGQLQACRILRGQNPEGSQACGSAGGAADEGRACDQSEDSEADRPDYSAEGAGAGGQSDQMTRDECRVTRGSSKEKDMKKKILVFTLCTLLFALCSSAQAQPQVKAPKIGWLLIGPDSGRSSALPAVPRELRVLGYFEGKNIAFDSRSADNKLDRLPALADELVSLKVDVLIATSTPGALAAKNATRTIPIVFYNVVDPVGDGLVDSLARPGGNITGITDIASVLT